jgi:hypothetical protein
MPLAAWRPRVGNARDRAKYAAIRLPPARSPEAQAEIFLPQANFIDYALVTVLA